MTAPATSQRSLALVLLATTGAPAMVSTTVSSLTPLIRADLDVSRTELGLFAVVLFTVTAVVSLPMGHLADRSNAIVGLVGVQLCLIAALVLMSLAVTLPVLLLAAIPGGIALAAVAPFTNRLVGLVGDPSRRGMMMATKQAGVPFAQLLVAIVCPAVAIALSWRAAPVVLLVIPIVLIVCAVLWSRSPSGGAAPVVADLVTRIAPSPSVRPRVLAGVLCVYALLSGIVFQAVMFGAPLFLSEKFGLDTATAAWSLVILGGVGLLSRVFVGFLIDRRQQPRSALIGIALIALVGLGWLGASSALGLAWMAWMGVAVYAIASTAVMIVLSTVLLTHYRLAKVGMLSGLIAVSTFVGFAAGPLLFGLITDLLDYTAAWSMLVVAAALTCMVPLLAGPWRVSSERVLETERTAVDSPVTDDHAPATPR